MKRTYATNILLGIVLLALLLVELLSLRETRSPLDILNPNGSAGRALVTYNPGLSDFQTSVARAVARSLVAAGWRVELTTTSRDTPARTSGYDLVVIGANTYWWTPDRPTRRFLRRADLRGPNVLLVVTASGQGKRSLARTTQLAEAAGATVVGGLTLYSWRPNDQTQAERPNRAVALELAAEKVRRLTEQSAP